MDKQLNSLILNVKKTLADISYNENLSHASSAFSMVDYLTVILSRYVVLGEDKVVVGKPFGGQAYHAIFQNILEGYQIAEENKMILGKTNSVITYVEETLANSVSAACGIALTTKKNVFVNISDSQLQSGYFWEGCLFAGSRRLSNIILSVDYNNMQCLGTVDSIISLNPLVDKFESFGWKAFTCDAYDTDKMIPVLNRAFAERDKPVAIIMLTKKGKGIDSMEDVCSSHGKKLCSEDYRRYYEKNFG